MKYTIHVSGNVNLIPNIYKCLFFQTATENMRCCSKALFGHAMQDKSARQASVEMERFGNLHHSKFETNNGANANGSRMECQQTYRSTDQNGSRQNTD